MHNHRFIVIVFFSSKTFTFCKQRDIIELLKYRRDNMLLNMLWIMWLMIAVTLVIVCVIRIVGLVMFIRNRDEFKVVDLSEHVGRK